MLGKPSLENVYQRSDLIGVARRKRMLSDRVTVRIRDLEAHLADGWTISRKNKTSYTLRRPKAPQVAIEDRLWILLYRMGFPRLSGSGGAQLSQGGTIQMIGILAQDDEVVLAVNCRFQETKGRRNSLDEEIVSLSDVRTNLAKAANAQSSTKLSSVLALVTQNVFPITSSRELAKERQVVLLDERDLAYYEQLVAQLGPAARHQFMADLIPGREIPGLRIRVPAVKSRMGGYQCYMFSVSPEYLLKIAYVSHRARGQDSDLAAYQRMVSRTRLRKIAKYISESDSIFPTNIVVNLDGAQRVQFDRGKQEEDAEFGVFGWLTLRPSYRSAWIIDGQHRLFAYSGHPLAFSSRLLVLAFDGLPGHVQQKLFIDINAEQKSVKKSLLQELYADLHKNSDDPAKRVRAIISDVIQAINLDPDSPLYDRVQLADSLRTPTRCISLNSIFSSLDRGSMFYGSIQNMAVINPGPLWGRDEASTRQRTIEILNGWFGIVRSKCADWWDLGAEEGGGLAMNDGVGVCLSVLRSVFDHLDKGPVQLFQMTPKEVMKQLSPFAEALGEHLRSMDQEQRSAFRALRGNQGQATGMRHAQRSIQVTIPSFQPDGLREFLDRETAQTTERASKLISQIETILHQSVIALLKEHFGTEGDLWWYDGVPIAVRTPATARQEEDHNRAGARDAYLDLIHYRPIIQANWSLLGELFSRGGRGKEKGTAWLVNLNEIRKICAHASRGGSVSFEQLNELNEYLEWLRLLVQGEGGASVEPLSSAEESSTE